MKTMTVTFQLRVDDSLLVPDIKRLVKRCIEIYFSDAKTVKVYKDRVEVFAP